MGNEIIQNKEESLKSKLEALKGESKLKDAVIDEALEYETDDDIKSFFEDLLNHGCVSGMIGSLIYYADTNKFFDDNEEEIEELVYEMQQELGYKKRAEFIASLNGSAESISQEKNLLSWFAFEETARKIYTQDLDFEF